MVISVSVGICKGSNVVVGMTLGGNVAVGVSMGASAAVGISLVLMSLWMVLLPCAVMLQLA